MIVTQLDADHGDASCQAILTDIDRREQLVVRTSHPGAVSILALSAALKLEATATVTTEPPAVLLRIGIASASGGSVSELAYDCVSRRCEVVLSDGTTAWTDYGTVQGVLEAAVQTGAELQYLRIDEQTRRIVRAMVNLSPF